MFVLLLFNVKACRGNKKDSGTLLDKPVWSPSQQKIQDELDARVFSYAVPNTADVAVMYSCPAGRYNGQKSYHTHNLS